ncbi:MAG: Lrp/AsnC family transcriptional regulator [Methanomassiliicoccales archaeon]|nr:MAG: Lrp/AsnC family transcriptional regulator [Methanomassiliicoccales archaeon]
MFELDETDQRILGMLNRDARLSFRHISRELNISLTKVRSRVKRMEREGVIKGYIPVIDPEVLGYDMLVVIGLDISKAKTLEIQEKIAKDPHAFAVFNTIGQWDSVLIARFKSRVDLDEFIRKVLSMKGVDKTYTQLVLNIMKDEKRMLLY